MQIGTLLANLLGGIIIEYVPGGWEAVFYIFGGISVVWFLLWCVLCYNDPSSHPFISESEKLYLKETIGETERKKVGHDLAEDSTRKRFHLFKIRNKIINSKCVIS